MKNKKWLIIFFSLVIIIPLLSGMLIFIIDPFFHYHSPLKFMQYSLKEERYQNNGILRNFDYNAIITGTSHTENFKTSEFDELFNVKSVKVPLAGAQFKEIAEQMQVAINNNDNIKCILYGITYEDILSNKDSVSKFQPPTYLSDDNILNDYQYIFNGSALELTFEAFARTITNKKTTSFDEYTNWNNLSSFSKKDVLSKYDRLENKKIAENLNEEEKSSIMENFKQNIIDIIASNKNIDFYLFFSPNSIVWWDKISQNGEILKYLEAEEILINELLKYDNVKLYSFFNNYEITCNIDNYRDITHYTESINSKILKWIKNDEYLITKDNVNNYLKQEKDFYLNYDYDKIFLDN